MRAINKRNRKEQKDRFLFHMGSGKLKLVKQSMVCYHTGMSKKIDTLRELLNLENSNRRSPFEEYYDALESINALVYNYPDWFDDKDVDEQLKKLDKADYNMACALMTLVLREDYWKNGSFDRRYHAGEVTPITEKMIVELEKEEQLLKWSDPVSFADLYKQNCSSIPKCPGVYRVTCIGQPVLAVNEKSSNDSALLYDAAILCSKYNQCKDKKVLYIGKANGKNGLQQRLKQYVLYGYNKSKIHKGGRAIWQLENSKDFMVEYACVDNPEEMEKQLITKYKEQNNGSYPLANWRL